MKKLVCIFAVIVLITSCGPHRMGCGAKGICEKPDGLTSKPV